MIARLLVLAVYFTCPFLFDTLCSRCAPTALRVALLARSLCDRCGRRRPSRRLLQLLREELEEGRVLHLLLLLLPQHELHELRNLLVAHRCYSGC